MPSKKLTDAAVERIKPPPAAKQIDYYDTDMPGLVLRVNYGGKKTWRALYYVKGTHKGTGVARTEPRTHPLGRYPVLKPKEARDAARKFLADPQKALAQASVGSFKDFAASFLKRHVEANKLRSQPEIERCLNKYIYPRWQDRPFHEIRRGDVTALLDQVEDNHGPRQADMCLAILSKMMNWYASRHDDYASPIVRGMGRANPAERRRKRILTDEEIRALWTGCTEINGTFGPLVKVLLLSAQRLDKVRTMEWNDLKDGVWTIPTDHREKSTAGKIALPRLALDIIKQQPRIAGNPHVFPGRGPGPFNAVSQRKEELDRKLTEVLPDTPSWVLHDLRRTARSLMSRAGVRPDIAERVLGHAIGGVEGVYDRHSYDAEKADALSKLAHLVETIANPPTDNVVAMAGGR